MNLTHLNVETELLQAFEEGFFVARHKRLHVRVDAEAHLRRLFLHLQLDAERGRKRREKRCEIQRGVEKIKEVDGYGGGRWRETE